MRPHQVQAALKQVLQQITAKQAATNSSSMQDILLSYGDDHNLAPAQLEKLAHTLNLTLCCSHAKYAGAEHRGDSFDLVDTPSLLDRYVDPGRARAGDTTKKASVVVLQPEWQSFSVGDHFRIDGKLPAVNWGKVDEVMDDPSRTGGWQKLARDMGSTSDHLTRLRTQVYNADNAAALRDECLKKATSCIAGIAKHIRHDEPYVKISQDITSMLGPDAAPVLAALDRYQRMYKSAYGCPVPPDERDFYHDRYGIIPLAKEAAEHLDDYEAYKLMVEEFRGNTKQAADDDEDEWENSHSVRTEADPLRRLISNSGGDLDKKFIEYHSSISEPTKTPKPAEGGKEPGKGKPEHAAPYIMPAHAMRGNYASDKPPLTSTVDARHDGMSPLLEALLGGATLAGDAANAGGQAAEGLGRVLGAAAPVQTAQRTVGDYASIFGHKHEALNAKLLKTMQDLRHKSVLQQLVLTDPVLRTADPSRVATIFDTLRRNSPGVASDINSARTIMREALQYQGIPISTVETLQKLNRPAPPAAAASR
jgi:hypothetical protein